MLVVTDLVGRRKKTHEPFRTVSENPNCFVNIRHLDPVTEMFRDYTSNMFTQHSTISLKQITVAGKFTLTLLICKKKSLKQTLLQCGGLAP